MLLWTSCRERERDFSRTAHIQAGYWIAQFKFTTPSYSGEILRIFLHLCNNFLGDICFDWRKIWETGEYGTKIAVAFSLSRSMSHVKHFEAELCFTFQNFILLIVPSLKLFCKSHTWSWNIGVFFDKGP